MKLVFLVGMLMFSFCSSALINGAEQTNTFPSVQLHFKNGSHICSGTFVDPYTILTAAHCLVEPNQKWSSFSLELEFIYDRFGHAVKFDLYKLVPHPDFKNSFIHSKHDIGVIKLARNNHFAHFPTLASNNTQSRDVILYGCGRVNIGSKRIKCLTGQNQVFNFLGYIAMWGNSMGVEIAGDNVSIALNDSGGALVDVKTNSIIGVHWGTTLNKYFSRFNIPVMSFSTSLINKKNYEFVVNSSGKIKL